MIKYCDCENEVMVNKTKSHRFNFGHLNPSVTLKMKDLDISVIVVQHSDIGTVRVKPL